MKRHLVILLVLSALVSCTRDDYFSFNNQEPSGPVDSWTEKPRAESEETRSVMLLYSAGFNTLDSFLNQNLKELDEGFIPAHTTRGDHILLVYSKLTAKNSFGNCSMDYSTPTKSALYRIYKDKGEIVKDTLKVYGEDVAASSAETLHDVLQIAYNRYPAKSYGMVFSSHASGWLPSGYYKDPSKFESGSSSTWLNRASQRNQVLGPLPSVSYSLPVKSLGQEENLPGNNTVEIELEDFAAAIPFKLDYLLLDACLSGCVEVAYELRGKADIIGFSQTEVLAQGFNYTTLTTHLLKSTPDPLQVCKDYFESYDKYYENNPGVTNPGYRSATISVVDTREMEPLASVCKALFEKYRETIKTMNASNVQPYFRKDQGNRHFFYDLMDILVNAGITSEEKASLQDALDQCIVYKAATDYFLSIKINTACGLSMYLPSMGTDFLDGFYKAHIAWNEAAQLVK